jgi:Transposase IS4
VCDNFFTSSTLGRELRDNQRTYLLGTIRPNRSGLPKEFIKEPLEVSAGAKKIMESE